MRHSVPLECSEWKAPCHHPLLQGSGAEEKADSVGVNMGELGEGLLGLWRSSGKFDGVQLSGEGDDGGR